MVVPVNKKTGQKHAPISIEAKAVWESHPMTKGQFDFVDVTPAPEPKESKKKSTGRGRKPK